jgi:hypothetical protein
VITFCHGSEPSRIRPRSDRSESLIIRNFCKMAGQLTWLILPHGSVPNGVELCGSHVHGGIRVQFMLNSLTN